MNDKNKHTPGPWIIQRYKNYEGFSIIGKTNSGMGCIAERWSEGQIANEKLNEEFKANARLIAAAPDLLKALYDLTEKVEAVLGNREIFGVLLESAYTAIEKAE